MSPSVCLFVCLSVCLLTVILLHAELQAKLDAATAEKQTALERSEAAEHQCSMLQLDLESTQGELRELKDELSVARSKVRWALSRIINTHRRYTVTHKR